MHLVNFQYMHLFTYSKIKKFVHLTYEIKQIYSTLKHMELIIIIFILFYNVYVHKMIKMRIIIHNDEGMQISTLYISRVYIIEKYTQGFNRKTY